MVLSPVISLTQPRLPRTMLAVEIFCSTSAFPSLLGQPYAGIQGGLASRSGRATFSKGGRIMPAMDNNATEQPMQPEEQAASEPAILSDEAAPAESSS